VPASWAEVDYLLWWLKKVHAPVSGLFNNGVVDYSGQSGIRVSGGTWLDADHCYGLDGSIFWLEHARVGGLVNPPLRLGGTPTSVRADNHLWGGEINGRIPSVAIFFADRLEFLAGIRTVEFGEGISYFTPSFPVPAAAVGLPAGNAPALVSAAEQVRTTTQFLGGQVGLASHWYCKGFTFDCTGKFALGANLLSEHALGTTQVGGANNVQGGLPGGVILPATANGGDHRTTFATLGEVSAVGGYWFTPGFRALVGYNIFCLDQTVRAPGQVDAVVVGNGTFRPRGERFYVQGVNLGLEFAW
jgi:hypothetical protein